ncbi:Cold-regulated 413 plasma membrane protein 2 [Zea mays]|uniref:Cold-regulated 413 plasma membrane protein 2 n=1 Tax=Zea mays TaxID=4577 RepID=A0A1D6L642_MAIZE|nr:Cold-regulated 413 plasma membrane protein 2 [Zea mays]
MAGLPRRSVSLDIGSHKLEDQHADSSLGSLHFLHPA